MGKSKRVAVLDALKQLTVEPYLFFFFMGYVIRLVSYQSLLMDRACRNTFEYSDNICDHIDSHTHEQAQIMEGANNLYTISSTLSSLPAIIVAIYLGPWSDKYSRKYPLIIAVSGMFLESLSAAILTAFPGVAPMWFSAVSLFAGISGGIFIGLSAAGSYLSDITDERSRSARFAVLEFFGILAIITGSVVGGQVFNRYGYLTVMSLSPVCFGCCLLYAIFIVKETKPPVPVEKRKEMFRDLFRNDNIKQSYKTCSRERPGNIRLQIWLLVWVSASQKFVDMGTVAVAFVYARKMYKWGVTFYSNASTIFYVINAVTTITIIPFLSNKLRLHEAAIGLIGMLSMMAKMVLIAVAFSGPYFYFGFISGSLSTASGIAVRSRLSKLVYKEELGRAFSLLGTCESVTPLLGTVLFLQIYNASLNVFPGLVFALACVFLLPSALIFLWMTKMPTISLVEYAREEEMKKARPLETISSNYNRLKEEE